MKRGLGITLMLLLMTAASYAQEVTARVDARQRMQHVRIRQGRATGELTNREAARLNAEQRHIRRTERRIEADGQVTLSERKRLHRAQQNAHRDIRRQKHDRQSRIN